jgi:hypothetical protein
LIKAGPFGLGYLLLFSADGTAGIAAPGAFHAVGAVVFSMVGRVFGTKDQAKRCFLKTHAVQMDKVLSP